TGVQTCALPILGMPFISHGLRQVAVIALTLMVVFSTHAQAQTPTTSPAGPALLSWPVAWGVLTAIFILIALGWVQRCLSTSNWSMGEALKEPYPMPTTPPAQPAPQVVVAPAPAPTPTPTPTPAPPAAPAPAAGPVMLVASSSRFIALVGLVVMVGLYLSF